MALLRIYRDLQEARQKVLRRLPPDETPTAQVREGLRRIFGEEIGAEEAARRILADVRVRGNQAALDWTERIDGLRLQSLEVPSEQVQVAKSMISPDLLVAMETAAARIRAFHERQPRQSWMDLNLGGTLGQIVRPLDRVGIYAPAGTAPLPSSLLMSAIPARVAGVGQIVVMTPPQKKTGTASPLVLAAAAIAGVDRIFTLGGAQAIGAVAYGTASVPRVDKICGPGNLFVTLAKRQVYGWVGIDGLPGPTETLIITDENADAERVAADLLAQAEHDVMASAILLTPSAALAERVQAAVERQFSVLSRQSIISVSLVECSGIVLVRDVAEAVSVANDYAPEHLCLDVADPWQYLEQIRHAGGVFLGGMSCEVLGDYVAGPSHIMPTGGTARFASPQNVWDFCKITSLIALGAEEAGKLASAAARFAEAEGLDAHATAARLRARS